jgi:hypothetical protein
MDQFMYLADPRHALRMHDSAHLEHVRRAEWRNARHIEELQRSRRAESRPPREELDVRPRASRRFPWPSWRGVLGSLHLAGSVQ